MCGPARPACRQVLELVETVVDEGILAPAYVPRVLRMIGVMGCRWCKPFSTDHM